MNARDDVIFEYRTNDVAAIVFESAVEGLVRDLCKGRVAGSEYGDFFLVRQIGIYVPVLLGQESGEIGQVFLVVEQFRKT